MERCCISSKKNTANENSSVIKTKQKRFIILSNCAVSSKKIYICEKWRTPLNTYFIKINEIINKFH